MKFKVIERAQRVLRGAAGKSFAEPFKKMFLLQNQVHIIFMVLKYCLSQKKLIFLNSRVVLPPNKTFVFNTKKNPDLLVVKYSVRNIFSKDTKKNVFLVTSHHTLALRGLLLSKFSKNRFFFYVKMFLSIIKILP